jgi:hypothetical protein
LHGLGSFDFVEGIYYEPLPLHDYYKRDGSRTTSPSAWADFEASCRALIAMGRRRELLLQNEKALRAMEQFLTESIRMEQIYGAEDAMEAPMRFYGFLQQHRATFLSALNVVHQG